MLLIHRCGGPPPLGAGKLSVKPFDEERVLPKTNHRPLHPGEGGSLSHIITLFPKSR